MTENYTPPLPVGEFELPPLASSAAPPPATTASTGDQESTATDVAKDQAASVGQGAAEASQHVATVAKEQAAQVGAEAGRQVKDLLTQAQGQLSVQAGAQQQKLVSGLQSLRDELHSMAQNADHPSVGSDLVRQAADRTGTVAGWLDGREPAALLDDVTAFARRRPGAFLAMAGGLGLLAGRLTRGLKASSDTPQQAAPATADSRAPYPAPAMTIPPAPAVGLGEPLAAPIVADIPTAAYLGDPR
jgi:hypothetical protein